ncbi:MAG TPA: hypothetical protein DCY89_06705 [Gammaproteobacteria bacterium]|nr:hypothetical protein [Gammaproteobacteria bacterium]
MHKRSVRPLLTTLLLGLAGLPALAANEGRYQVLPLTDETGGVGSDRVFIIDTISGHLWTWTEVPAGDGSSGGRFLIYQGQVKPGAKIGEIVEKQDWQPEPAPQRPAK